MKGAWLTKKYMVMFPPSASWFEGALHLLRDGLVRVHGRLGMGRAAGKYALGTRGVRTGPRATVCRKEAGNVDRCGRRTQGGGQGVEVLLPDRKCLVVHGVEKKFMDIRGQKEVCSQDVVLVAIRESRGNDVQCCGRESCTMYVAELEQQLEEEVDSRLEVESQLEVALARANRAESRLAGELDRRIRLREYLDLSGVAMTVVREDMAEDLHQWLFGRLSPVAMARRLRCTHGC